MRSTGRASSGAWRRRILVKLDATALGRNLRFMVSNRAGRAADLIAWYADRGQCENGIKELKRDVLADRLGCHRYRANALRLQLYTLAPLVLAYFRRAVLAATSLATATVGTIRLRVFEVAGRVCRRVRRLWFHLASGWPGRPIFMACHHALPQAPT
jgi:hypothetical protein